MFRNSKSKLPSKCSTYRRCPSNHEETSPPAMHHQSLHFPKPYFGESARHGDISLTAALGNSHKQKHRHCLKLLYSSLQHGPVVWLMATRTNVSEANTASHAQSGEWRFCTNGTYPRNSEAHNTSLHCCTSLERYERSSQSNGYFFSHAYDHFTELHNTAEGTVTLQKCLHRCQQLPSTFWKRSQRSHRPLSVALKLGCGQA